MSEQSKIMTDDQRRERLEQLLKNEKTLLTESPMPPVLKAMKLKEIQIERNKLSDELKKSQDLTDSV